MNRQMIPGVVLTAAALGGCGAGAPPAGVGDPPASAKLDVIFVATALEIVNAMLTLATVTRDDLGGHALPLAGAECAAAPRSTPRRRRPRTQPRPRKHKKAHPGFVSHRFGIGDWVPERTDTLSVR